MKCPRCGADTRVLETRDALRRRRECFNLHRFWTREVVESEPCYPKNLGQQRRKSDKETL